MKIFLHRTLFMLSMLFTTVSVSAYEYDFEIDGIYYYIESRSDLTVSVSRGEVKYEGDLVIPSSVQYDNRTLSVTAIGNEAFYECSDLTSISIPNSVTFIGDCAFWGCASLTSIDIPDSVIRMGTYAFADCAGLTSFNIPNSVLYIGEHAFHGCSGLISVTIPNSVISIGSYAFGGCSQLKVIPLYEGLKEIGECCFMASGIEELIIPNSVTEIGKSILCFSYGLKKLQIGTGLNNIGTHWFSADLTKYKNFEILNVCDSDVKFNFKDLEEYDETGPNYQLSQFPLKEIYIGRPLTWESSCFPIENTLTLNKIEFGGFCERNYSLYGCTALKTLILGENIKNVYAGSAIPVDSLTEIYVKALVPPTVNKDFDNKIYLNATLYIPEGTLEAYQAADIWKNFWNVVEYDYSAMSKVETVTRDNVSVTVEGSSIVVNSPVPDAAIDLYDLSGRLLYHGHDTAIDNLTGGIYIVKLLGKTFKVAVK